MFWYIVPSFIVHGSWPGHGQEGGGWREEKGREGEEEDLLPAHPILCQSSLAQVQAGVLRGACLLSIIPPFCHIVIFFIQSPLPQTNQNLMNAKESLCASILCPSRPAVPRLGAYSPSLPLLLCSSFARHSIIAGKFVICYGWPVKCYARPLRPSPPSPLFSISVGRG